MELVLQSRPVVNWQFIAAKKLEAPKNIGEFIARVPEIILTFFDQLGFELDFQVTWFFKRIIFQ